MAKKAVVEDAAPDEAAPEPEVPEEAVVEDPRAEYERRGEPVPGEYATETHHQGAIATGDEVLDVRALEGFGEEKE